MSTEELSHGMSGPTAPDIQPWMARWLPTLSEAARHYHRRQNTAFLIMFVVLIAGVVASLTLLHGKVSGWGMAGIIAVVVIVSIAVASVFEKRFVQPLLEGQKEQIEEIRAAIEQHNLPSSQIVRGIAAEIKSCKYRDDVMKAIDPAEATLLLEHDKVIALLEELSKAFSAKTPVFKQIEKVTDLQNHAYSYAKDGLYAEAIAMLSAAELLYKGIGAAVPQVRWQSGNTVYTANAPWANFSFRDQVSALTNVVARRKTATQVVEMLQAMTGQAEITDLLNIDRGVSIEIRDQEIITKCAAVATVYGVFVATTSGMETILTLSYLPGDHTILDAAIAAFRNNPFVPQLIEACIRRGAEMEPALVDLLKGDNANGRFNAALALGIMRSARGAEAAREVLDSRTDALTRIGALFVLVHAGETERQQEILPYLDDPDAVTVHAAAIALEHLPLPVPDPVLETHLRGKHRLVRLRLTRHIRRYTEVSPGVRDAVSELVTDEDDDVGMAAAETMSALLSGDALFELAQERLSRTEDRSIRRRLLLMVGRARTEAAADLLLQEWQARRWGRTDKENASHILSCLGQTQSARVMGTLFSALDNKDQKLPALMALIAVAQQHPGKALHPAQRIRDNVVRAFVQALLSADANDVEAFKQKLASATGDQRTLALQLAAVLAHPALEEALDGLRISPTGNEVEKPTWRYLATRASFAVLMRKTAS